MNTKQNSLEKDDFWYPLLMGEKQNSDENSNWYTQYTVTQS